jgi:EAL domain-containing protein (putative c-di-GMP-specific phosphodiesterase class I)
MQNLFDIVVEKTFINMQADTVLQGVSINLSPSQLENKELPSRLKSFFDGTTVKPSAITLELVESALVVSDYYETIRKLKRLGFRLSLDDFGTGYARYKTLIDLFNQGIINELKIDQVFVDEIESAANQSFIQSIIYLTKEFDISIVVEGVETHRQLEIIRSINPELIVQGWLASKALPIGGVRQLNESNIQRNFQIDTQ